MISNVPFLIIKVIPFIVENGEMENDHQIPFLNHQAGKKPKKSNNLKCWSGYRETQNLYTAKKNIFWQDLLKLKMYLPCNPETMSYLPKRNSNSFTPQNAHSDGCSSTFCESKIVKTNCSSEKIDCRVVYDIQIKYKYQYR